MAEILTPQSLWKDYTDDDFALNERIVHKYREGGEEITEVYFDGVGSGKGYARVYSVIATPADRDIADLPVMLIIDGVGKEKDLELLRYWAAKGYIAIMPDYCGGDGLKTIYPEYLEYCNMDKAERRYTHVDTTAKETCWYNWAFCMRRAVSYVQSVYGSKDFYIYGRYEGVRLAIMLLAIDQRLKAGALLFGCLWEDIAEGSAALIEKASDLKTRLQIEEEQERRLAGIAPQAYAALVEKPIIVIQGTNSLNADVIKNYEIFSRMKNAYGSTFVYLPRMTEGYDSDVDERIADWFASPVSAKQIDIKAEQRDGRLYARVDLIKLDNPEFATVYYSRGNVAQPVRNWVEAKGGKMLLDDYFVPIEVVNPSEPVFIFAEVKTGDRLFSSRIITAEPARLGVTECKETTKIIYQGKWGKAEFVPLNPEKPQTPNFVRNNPICMAAGAFDVMGVKGRALATFALNDDKVQKNPDSALTFDVCSKNAQTLNVFYVINFGSSDEKCFVTSISLVGGRLWQKVSVSLDDFKSSSGADNHLKAKMERTALAFTAEEDIILNNILFT